MVHDSDERGLSRRDVMRRSAVVAGSVVWATPVVQSLTSPAFATGDPTTGSPPDAGCPSGYRPLRYIFEECGDGPPEIYTYPPRGCAWPEYEAAERGNTSRINTTGKDSQGRLLTRTYNNMQCMKITFKSTCNCEIKASSVLLLVGKQVPGDDHAVSCASPSEYTVTFSGNTVNVCMHSAKITYVAMLVCCQ